MCFLLFFLPLFDTTQRSCSLVLQCTDYKNGQRHTTFMIELLTNAIWRKMQIWHLCATLKAASLRKQSWWKRWTFDDSPAIVQCNAPAVLVNLYRKCRRKMTSCIQCPPFHVGRTLAAFVLAITCYVKCRISLITFFGRF